MRVSVLRPMPRRPGRLDAPPARVLQRLHDQSGLEIARERLGDAGFAAREPARDFALEHAPPVAFARVGRGGTTPHFRWKVFHVDELAGRHDGHPMANVFELAHVSGPVLPHEELQGRLRQALAVDAQLARAFRQEVACERRDVLAPFTQRRKAQADHVDAVVEVLAKQALLHARLELLVRGGDHAHVRRERRVPADAVELAIGKHAQQACLQVLGHVADLVQEQGAALGLLETPAAHRLRAGEGAALVAEELALEEVLGDRGGVDRDERLCRPRAVPVQRQGDELLPGSGFAGDEHGRVRLRKPPDGAKYLLHRRRLPEDLGLPGAVGGHGLDLPPAFLERAAHELDGMVDVEGLRKVFERPALERRYRAFEVGVRRHDDHRRGWNARLQLLHEFQSRESGHADVAHHDLRRLLGEPVKRLLRRAESAMRDAFARECLLEHPTDRAVIVDDPHGIH